jgi:hypothetical protein
MMGYSDDYFRKKLLYFLNIKVARRIEIQSISAFAVTGIRVFLSLSHRLAFPVPCRSTKGRARVIRETLTWSARIIGDVPEELDVLTADPQEWLGLT